MNLSSLTLDELNELKNAIELEITNRTPSLTDDFTERAAAELEEGTLITNNSGIISVRKGSFVAGTLEGGKFFPGKGIGYFMNSKDNLQRKKEALEMLLTEFLESGEFELVVPKIEKVTPVVQEVVKKELSESEREGLARTWGYASGRTMKGEKKEINRLFGPDAY